MHTDVYRETDRKTKEIKEKERQTGGKKEK